MTFTHWQVLLNKDEAGGVHCTLLEETPDGLDLHEICRASFGPFDTAADVTQWITRHWAPRARLPLR